MEGAEERRRARRRRLEGWALVAVGVGLFVIDLLELPVDARHDRWAVAVSIVAGVLGVTALIRAHQLLGARGRSRKHPP